MTDELKVVKSPTIKDVELNEEPKTDPLTPSVDPSSPSDPADSFYISPIITLTGTTPNINCGNGANRIFEIVLSGNTTYTISNVRIGQPFIVRVQQGSGTTYTNTWFGTTTWVSSGGTAPVQTTVSNGVTTYGFICRAAGTFDGYLLGKQ